MCAEVISIVIGLFIGIVVGSLATAISYESEKMVDFTRKEKP